jgi:hypothetical protein
VWRWSRGPSGGTTSRPTTSTCLSPKRPCRYPGGHGPHRRRTRSHRRRAHNPHALVRRTGRRTTHPHPTPQRPGAAMSRGLARDRTGSDTHYRQQRLIAWRRDRGVCVWCGRHPHLRRCTPQGCGLCFEADHLVHTSNGGTDDHSNLLTSCRDCNQSRGTNPMPKPIATNATPSPDRNPMAGVQRQW